MQNMKLYTSFWGDKDTFKMLPITKDCPYTEVIYDPRTTLLVVISKNPVEKYQMVEKLDDDGNPVMAKKPKANKNPYKEQRVMFKTLQEHFITDKDEQEAFIKDFAINFEEFNYSLYLRDMGKEGDAMVAPQQTKLFDEKGTIKTIK